MKKASAALAMAVLCSAALAQVPANTPKPHLENRDGVRQLMVDGQPFLILGGELHNSSSSSLAYMKTLWPVLVEKKLNTVLAAVSWELIEPQEGKFDFTLVDGLIEGARQNRMHLVFLWFGSWKNGVSSYPPLLGEDGSQAISACAGQIGQNAEHPFDLRRRHTGCGCEGVRRSDAGTSARWMAKSTRWS